MLGKLIKHEFRATGRIMLPLMGALLMLGVVANVSTRVLDSGRLSSINFVNVVCILALIIFVAGIMAVCIISVILMVQRFHRHLLGDEGYLTFTLPVSVHSIVWSKLIVSVIWFAAAVAAVILAVMIAAFRAEFVSEVIELCVLILSKITAELALNGAVIITELAILLFFAGASMCLLFYAAMAVGHGFAGRKVLMSVVFFFVFWMAFETLELAVMFGLNALDIEVAVRHWSNTALTHSVFGLAILDQLIYCAVFYVITTWALKKRLNLE